MQSGLRGSRKGQLNVGLAAIAIALVVASITYVIGIYVTATFQSTLNVDALSAAAQAQITNVFTTTYNSYNIAIIGMIILAAFGILAATGMVGGGRRR